ncbi:MAG: hypothetical protein JNG85_10115 [Spirochaetaceae bacterium]|nr:hypothetical protein [Spirochaetaceae bacterium]
MDLSFYKLRVCDADILLVDDFAAEGKDRDWPAAARELLDRRRGVGAERLAVLSRAEGSIWLRAYSPDGESATALFDAALCAARFLLDSGRSGSESVEFRVPRGGLAVDVLDGAGLGLSLGPPRGLPDGEALDQEGLASRKSLIEAGGERYEVLPLCLGRSGAGLGAGAAGRGGEAAGTTDAAGGEAQADGSAAPEGERIEAVAVFCERGAKAAKMRIGAARRGAKAPTPLPVRLVSRGELWAEAPRGKALDAAAAAGLAHAAAVAAGYADSGALVRLRGGALWVEWTESGGLYAAARPEYVYRGEFHLGDRS